MALIQIKPENVYALRNSTGRPFTDHMDTLLRSAATVVGIANKHISDNPRTNVADGGVDTEIAVPAWVSPEPWGYFGCPTAWQYKAVEVSDLTDAAIREEITKPSKNYIRQLIRNGYGYRMCIAHDGTAEKKAEIKASLDEEIAKVNIDAPKSIVLFAKDIVAWTNAFPPLAATMLGTELAGFKLFDTWRVNETSKTPNFVATTQSSQIRDRVREYLDWSKKPNPAKLTISGDSGVGKTRAIFEALAETPDARGLVFYTDDEDNALQLAQNLANHHDSYAVLVADECDDAVAFRIGRSLQGFEHLVRLITIDNALTVTDQTELRLTPLPQEKVEEVLRLNFPEVEASRRFQYSQLAGGFLLFAISLCQNDTLIQEQGHYGQPLLDVQGYLAALFAQGGVLDPHDRDALNLISLVERCGVVGNVAVELEQLCALVGLDPRDISGRLNRMQKSVGLVGRAGRYFSVTPAPIAAVCFQAAWNRWAEPDTKQFLESFPRRLSQGLLSRVSRASTEVGRVVTAYFRDWLISRGAGVFLSEADTEQLLFLVRADPDRMLNRLRDLVMEATPEQLAHSGRRWIVTELTEIARFPQWFAIAEEMLFRLALDESEPDIGNNATELWTALFGIYGSSVATPFPDRLKILQARALDKDSRVRELCVAALDEATDDRAIHLISQGGFGRRIPPSSWHPKTWDEYFGYMKDCLALLRSLIADENEAVSVKAAKAFVDSIRHALFRNILEPAKEGAGDIPGAVRPVLRSELRELVLLHEKGYANDGSDQEKKMAFIRAWIDELAPTQLHDQMVEDIGTTAWSHHLEETQWTARLDVLAQRLLDEEGALDRELAWINSRAAGSAVDLGIRIGRLDAELTYLNRIADTGISAGRPELLRGYFFGVSETFARTGKEKLKVRCSEVLDELWQKNIGFAYDAMLPSGDFLDSFCRAIKAVRTKQLPAAAMRSFAAWNGPRHTTRTEAKSASEVLLAISREGDKDAASTALDFIHFALMREQAGDPSTFLIEMFEDVRLETVFGLLEESSKGKDRISHWFQRLFQLALPSNPARGVGIAVWMLAAGDFEARQAASGLLHTLGTANPTALMEALGKALLDQRNNMNFAFRKVGLAAIPDDVVIAWLKAHGVEGARALARHVIAPYMGTNGPELNAVTAFLMENFGEDERVFSSFVAGMHSGGVFAGPISDWMQRGVTLAEEFTNYPIPSIRRWARNEVQFGTKQAEEFREREEERGF
jgi:hypothetical protein